jgi:AraC-like DNA-binding protein
LFAQEGGAQAYIRERRLQAALRALQAQGHREPIGLIAERLGFSDGAHMSRLFRARFGITPSDARADAALSGPEAGS